MNNFGIVPSYFLWITLPSEKVGEICRRNGHVVEESKTDGILSMNFNILLNHLKYKGNKSIAFYVRGLTLNYFSLF